MRNMPTINNDFTTTNWSMGETTQLYIHPKTAEYGLRNFDFRVSRATVSDEMSIFTNLTGYERVLMILEGRTTLFINKKENTRK